METVRSERRVISSEDDAREDRKKWQRLRIGALCVVLSIVLLFAWKEWRRQILGWVRPHRVAVGFADFG
jgi:hypothetical protein